MSKAEVISIIISSFSLLGTFAIAVATGIYTHYSKGTIDELKRQNKFLKEKSKEVNSIRLFKIWNDYHYNESLDNLRKKYDLYHNDDTRFAKLDKEDPKIIQDILKIKNFITRILYYLDSEKITMESLSLEFSDIFYFDDRASAAELYRVLKKYDGIFYIKYPRSEKYRDYLKKFLLKIAEFQNYEDLKKAILKNEI